MIFEQLSVLYTVAIADLLVYLVRDYRQNLLSNTIMDHRVFLFVMARIANNFNVLIANQ